MENCQSEYHVSETDYLGPELVLGNKIYLKADTSFPKMAHEFQHAITNVSGDADLIAPVSHPQDTIDGGGTAVISEREATRMENIIQREFLYLTVPRVAEKYRGITTYTGNGFTIDIPYPFGREEN